MMRRTVAHLACELHVMGTYTALDLFLLPPWLLESSWNGHKGEEMDGINC